MSSGCRIAAFALCGVFHCGAAPAQEVLDAQALADPVLDALVAEALRANPELLALQEGVVAARARPDQARALADPTLSVVYTNDGWSPSLLGRIADRRSAMGILVGPIPSANLAGFDEETLRN